MNQLITASEFRHWHTWEMDLRLELISSRMTFLTLPISLLAGLISLHFGLCSKFSLWSLREIEDCLFAMGSILLSMPRLSAMTSSSWLISSSIVLLPRLYVIVILLLSSWLYVSDVISYRFVVLSEKTKNVRGSLYLLDLIFYVL